MGEKLIALDYYDAGLLGDGGGGDVSWWQDYMRSELDRAHEFYQSQVDAHLTQPAQAVDVGAIQEVIRSMAQFATPGGLYDYWSRQLTAALPNANGKEGS